MTDQVAMARPDASPTDDIHQRTLQGHPLDCLVIDAHAHLMGGTSSMAHVPYASSTEMVEAMDSLGIDKACISVIGAGDGNGDMLQAVRDHPGRLLGMVLINPRYPELIEPVLAECFAEPGVVGIGEVHPTSYHHDYPIVGPAYEPVWEYAAQRSLPVLIHAGPTSESHRCRPSDLGRVAARHPAMNVLIGHCGGYNSWEMLDEAIATAQAHDNVFLEICAMARFTGVLEYLVDQVGEDKVLFGTDAPFHDWHAEVAHVAFAKIPDGAKEKVFGATMAQLLEAAR